MHISWTNEWSKGTQGPSSAGPNVPCQCRRHHFPCTFHTLVLSQSSKYTLCSCHFISWEPSPSQPEKQHPATHHHSAPTPPFYPTVQVHFHHHLTWDALQNLHGKASALNSHNIARLLDIIKHSCSGMCFFLLNIQFLCVRILLHLSLVLSIGPDIYIINNEQQMIENSQCW